jgi:outer membrane autotransporter protein
MGLEMEVAEGATLGTAFAFANGLALPGGENARVDSRAAQAAVYGSYQLGDGAYVAGLAAAERSRTGIERQASNGEAITALTGATETARYSAMLETGVNMPVAKGLTLTPRASLGYSAYHLSGFREAGSEAALALDDLRLNRLDARVGAKFAGSTPVGRSGWSFVPQIQADWVQNLSGARSGMTVRFANAPDAAIALPLLDGDTSWTEVKGGMRLTNGSVEIGAGLEGSFGRQSFRDERAVADLTIRF